MTNIVPINQQGTELVSYEDRWKKLADEAVEREPQVSSTFFSTKGGVFRVGDDVLGSQLCVVVLNAAYENTYYEGEYDPSQSNSPTCYSFSENGQDMAPHVSMMDDLAVFDDQGVKTDGWFFPQNADCKTCPLNKYGSALKGEGKACQNRRRLALLPAGLYVDDNGHPALDLFEDPEHFRRADIVRIKLPVTSGKHWAKYAKEIAKIDGRPPYGVFTRMYLVNSTDNQFEVHFEKIDNVPNELIDVMQGRYAQSSGEMFQAYKRPSEDGGPKKGSGKKLRR